MAPPTTDKPPLPSNLLLSISSSCLCSRPGLAMSSASMRAIRGDLASANPVCRARTSPRFSPRGGGPAKCLSLFLHSPGPRADCSRKLARCPASVLEATMRTRVSAPLPASRAAVTLPSVEPSSTIRSSSVGTFPGDELLALARHTSHLQFGEGEHAAQKPSWSRILLTAEPIHASPLKTGSTTVTVGGAPRVSTEGTVTSE